MGRLGDHLSIASPSGGSALQLVPSLEEVTRRDREPARKIADAFKDVSTTTTEASDMEQATGSSSASGHAGPCRFA